jgi:hypothetical protein
MGVDNRESICVAYPQLTPIWIPPLGANSMTSFAAPGSSIES